MKAIIGITTQYKQLVEKTMIETNRTYVDAIVKAGGIPILIPIIRDDFELEKYIDLVDGIIFSGGEDVLPAKYGEEPIKGIGSICVTRDNLELKLLELAMKKSIPILGICRGLQLLNIGLGGTLYQDISAQRPDSQEHVSVPTVPYGFHHIDLVEEGFLREIFKKDEIFVNSLHHQGIKDLGKNLKVVAQAKDGLIEAVEDTEGKHIYGVQFHPESMIGNHGEFIKIFQHFLDKCI